jgi:hypothetical protein
VNSAPQKLGWMHGIALHDPAVKTRSMRRPRFNLAAASEFDFRR